MSLISGESPGSRARTSPEAPLTRCIPAPVPRGRPYSPAVSTLPNTPVIGVWSGPGPDSNFAGGLGHWVAMGPPRVCGQHSARTCLHHPSVSALVLPCPAPSERRTRGTPCPHPPRRAKTRRENVVGLGHLGRRGGPQVCGQHSARTCLHHPSVSALVLPCSAPERRTRWCKPGLSRAERKKRSLESLTPIRAGVGPVGTDLPEPVCTTFWSLPLSFLAPPPSGDGAVSSPSPASQDKKGERIWVVKQGKQGPQVCGQQPVCTTFRSLPLSFRAPPPSGEEDARYAVSSPSPASQDKKGESGRVCLGGWQTRGEYGPPRGKGGRKARLPGVPRDTSGPGDPAFPQISSPRAPPSRPWFQLN